MMMMVGRERREGGREGGVGLGRAAACVCVCVCFVTLPPLVKTYITRGNVTPTRFINTRDA